MSDTEVRIRMSPLQAGQMFMKVDRLEDRIDELELVNEQLLEALKMAYRKHVANDDSVGWDELSDIMTCAIPEAMGDEEFIAWQESI